MPQFILYIAQSLDGYIADINGSTQWLHDLPNPEQSDYGFHDFLNSVDTVVMGRKTYETIQGFDIPWPYSNQKSYVLSSKELKNLPSAVVHLNDLNGASLEKLKSESTKNIWLVGGGQLINHCLDNNLLEKIILFTMPITLGKGVDLFPAREQSQSWQLSKCEVYSSGVIEHQYLPQA